MSQDPQREEHPLPPFAALWLGEILARQERERNDAMEEIAQAIGLTLSEGWGVDLATGCFVRTPPPPVSSV